MQNKPFDVYLLFVTLLLVFVGTVMVFSSSAVTATETYHDAYYFLKKNLIFVSFGLLCLFITKSIPYQVYKKLVYPLLAIIISLLVAVLFIGHGGGSSGVKRWIHIGSFSLQPTEFAKLAVILFVAYALSKKREKVRDFVKGFLPILFVSGVFLLLILAQRDLGSAFTLASIIMMMFFISGTRLVYLLGLIGLSIPALYVLIFSVDFRRQRILAFLDPWQHRLDAGFQIIQSYVAFQSGGLTGVGLGEGKQKLFYLPEAHTDFIFSVVGEELGFIGVLVVIGLFTFFMFRGFTIALKSKDPFGMYLAFGITCLIGFQALINMAVVMGLLPTKGLTLPFLSYGGSSLVMCLMSVGILLNISMHTGDEN